MKNLIIQKYKFDLILTKSIFKAEKSSVIFKCIIFIL